MPRECTSFRLQFLITSSKMITVNFWHEPKVLPLLLGLECFTFGKEEPVGNLWQKTVEKVLKLWH